MQFVYLIENAGHASDALIAERGLDAVLEKGFSRTGTNDVVCGGVARSGALVSQDVIDGKLLRKFDWTEKREITGVDGDAGIWIGMHRDAPPREEELRRRKQIDGYAVKLGASETGYMVPKALMYYDLARPPANGLPGAVVMRRGVWEKHCEDVRMRRLHLLAHSIAEGVLGGDVVRFDANFAVEVLGLNYRIGVAEASLMRLLYPEGRITEILEAFCDIVGARKLAREKKMEPAVAGV